MNRLAQARQALVDAVAPVLSGRTWPYPPSQTQAAAAPAVFIGQPDGFRTTIGERTAVLIATFPIHVVYDGADRAQVAGLDEVISGLVDAVAHVPGAEVARWRSQPLEPNTNRRAATVEVDYTITARTLCLPDVGGDVVHGPDDVVEGSSDVVFHGPIAADVPPALVMEPANSGGAITPPELVDTPPAEGDPVLPPDLVPNP